MKKRIILLAAITMASFTAATLSTNSTTGFLSPFQAFADEPEETEEPEGGVNKFALYSNPEGTLYCCGEGNVRPSCGETPRCK